MQALMPRSLKTPLSGREKGAEEVYERRFPKEASSTAPAPIEWAVMHAGRWAILSCSVAFCACVRPGSARVVRQVDLDAWVGVSTAELQLQPLFSTLPKAVERLEDGSELWTYSNCGTSRTATVCTPEGNNVICQGGVDSKVCCH